MAGKARNRHRNMDSLQVQRERANKRERERTKSLNSAYIELRQKIPSLPSDKTSKIHTLRVTIEYIHFLHEMAYNQNNILNRMDLTLYEDNQINLPATFNSWRTYISQKWHTKLLKQQQKRQQYQQDLNNHPQMQPIIDPSHLLDSSHLLDCSTSKVSYCPAEFPMFINAECSKAADFMPKPKDKKVKSETEECFYTVDRFGYGFADPSISLNCALGQAITQTHL